MLPPPHPIVTISSIGNWIGQSPRFPPRLVVGCRSLMSDTSVLVPPISKEMQFKTPVLSAICKVAITPAAGPDRAVWTG